MNVSEGEIIFYAKEGRKKTILKRERNIKRYELGRLGLTHIVVQSVGSDPVTPWTAEHQASLTFASPGACSNLCPLSQ